MQIRNTCDSKNEVCSLNGRKHFENGRKFCLQTFSPFPKMFSKLSEASYAPRLPEIVRLLIKADAKNAYTCVLQNWTVLSF